MCEKYAALGLGVDAAGIFCKSWDPEHVFTQAYTHLSRLKIL
jgi:hypothetical protein